MRFTSEYGNQIVFSATTISKADAETTGKAGVEPPTLHRVGACALVWAMCQRSYMLYLQGIIYRARPAGVKCTAAVIWFFSATYIDLQFSKMGGFAPESRGCVFVSDLLSFLFARLCFHRSSWENSGCINSRTLRVVPNVGSVVATRRIIGSKIHRGKRDDALHNNPRKDIFEEQAHLGT